MKFSLLRRLSCRVRLPSDGDEPDALEPSPDGKSATPTPPDARHEPALDHAAFGLEPAYATFRAHLLSIAQRIAGLDSLAPSPETNAALGALVAL